MATEPVAIPPNASSADPLYARVEAYPWDTDVEFQIGLSAILGSTPSVEQASELALRARCFYFTRKFSTPVDFDSYKAYRTSHSLPSPPIEPSQTPVQLAHGLLDTASPPGTPQKTPQKTPEKTVAPQQPVQQVPQTSGGVPPDAPYPVSFQEIVELITSGKPIPGIKEIPDTVLEGQGTQAAKPRRKKPWEKDVA